MRLCPCQPKGCEGTTAPGCLSLRPFQLGALLPTPDSQQFRLRVPRAPDTLPQPCSFHNPKGRESLSSPAECLCFLRANEFHIISSLATELEKRKVTREECRSLRLPRQRRHLCSSSWDSLTHAFACGGGEDRVAVEVGAPVWEDRDSSSIIILRTAVSVQQLPLKAAVGVHFLHRECLFTLVTPALCFRKMTGLCHLGSQK